MPPEHARAFGTSAGSPLSAVVLTLLIVGIALILLLPRKYVTLPILFFCLLVPVGPAVVLGGAKFFVSRILILAGLARVLRATLTSHAAWRARGSARTPRVQGRREIAGVADAQAQVPRKHKLGRQASARQPGHQSSESSEERRPSPLRFNLIDRAFVWFAISQAVATTLLFRDLPALINQVGMLVDVVGMYVLLRVLIADEADARRAVRCLAVVVAVFAVCMSIEQFTHFNVFSLLGGNRAAPELRDGAVRAQAGFAHPLMAGTFGATLLPVFGFLWAKNRLELAGIVGIIGATTMTIAANSSTPLSAYAAGVLGLVLWPLRTRMQTVRWGVASAIALLALVMKAPVWYIIAHLDFTGSSSSYHRAALIDQCFRHFGDWWLMGVKDAGAWGYDMWDAQNQYVAIAQSGGLLPLLLFIALIVFTFARIGNARNKVADDRGAQWSLWCLGAAVFANVVGFLGINYFDQSRIGWFLLLATISAVTAPLIQTAELSEEVPVISPKPALAYARPSGTGHRPRARH
jgi:hypothetical protein